MALNKAEIERLRREAQQAIAKAKAKRAQILMNVQLLKVKQLKGQLKQK